HRPHLCTHVRALRASPGCGPAVHSTRWTSAPNRTVIHRLSKVRSQSLTDSILARSNRTAGASPRRNYARDSATDAHRGLTTTTRQAVVPGRAYIRAVKTLAGLDAYPRSAHAQRTRTETLAYRESTQTCAGFTRARWARVTAGTAIVAISLRIDTLAAAF